MSRLVKRTELLSQSNEYNSLLSYSLCTSRCFLWLQFWQESAVAGAMLQSGVIRPMLHLNKDFGLISELKSSPFLKEDQHFEGTKKSNIYFVTFLSVKKML